MNYSLLKIILILHWFSFERFGEFCLEAGLFIKVVRAVIYY